MAMFGKGSNDEYHQLPGSPRSGGRSKRPPAASAPSGGSSPTENDTLGAMEAQLGDIHLSSGPDDALGSRAPPSGPARMNTATGSAPFGTSTPKGPDPSNGAPDSAALAAAAQAEQANAVSGRDTRGNPCTWLRGTISGVEVQLQHVIYNIHGDSEYYVAAKPLELMILRAAEKQWFVNFKPGPRVECVRSVDAIRVEFPRISRRQQS